MPQPPSEPAPASTANAYAAAGVSIEAADKAIELMKGWVDKARRPEVIGGIGGFAGLFDASALTRYERPLLATSTDGVGTKVAIAQAMDVHDTIGFDLVGMVVDDLVVCGAEPLFMTDYIATGRVVPERIAAIVKGIAEACVEAGCALIGGETAEHPGLLGPDEYDVAGRDHRRGRGRPAARPGPGPPRRRGDRDGGERAALQRLLPGAPRAARDRAAGRSTATSTSSAARSARSCSSPPGSTPRPAWSWPRQTGTHAMSHVTGGGLAANLERVMPVELSATSTASTWTPQPIFDLVRRVGDVAAARPGDDPQLRRRHGRADPADDVDARDRRARGARDPRLGGRRGPRRRDGGGRVVAGRPAPRLVTPDRRISCPGHWSGDVREHPGNR